MSTSGCIFKYGSSSFSNSSFSNTTTTSKANDEIVYAFTVANVGYGAYLRFCYGLGVNPISETRYTNVRTDILKKVEPLFAEQQSLVREFAEHKSDR